MAKTEDIEAKLAAYVDGDIDEAGRAEIEKHLQTNPKHRQLLSDLSGQRDLLRALPRDMAPGDVAETINSHLERAVLLGDVDGETEIAGTIGYWSQFRAVAAILLLTTGLAAVIYYFLPSPSRHTRDLADMRIQALPATEPTDQNPALAEDLQAKQSLAPEAALSVVASSPSDGRVQIAMRDDQPGGGGAVQSQDRQLAASNAMPPRDEIFSQVVQSRSAMDKVDEAFSASTYIVSTDDPGSTARDVRDYLASKNITWESALESMPVPLDASQEQNALSSRLQPQAMVQLKTAAAPSTMPSPVSQPDRIIAKQVTRQQAVALRMWLDGRQARAQGVASPAISAEELTLSPGAPEAAIPTTLPSTENPTTQPYAMGLGLSEFLDFSPPRVDAPGIELKPHLADAIPITQPQNLSLAAQIPTTAPSDSERMDVVIVLAPPTATTHPAATEPADLAVPQP